ncbi:Haloacid dehalogenase domain protein hydrolase [Candidatus Promineifilum breve]|uniref:Haloacid dehalogenase domain protein hydrolase n=1 Tax=Candidatus Promineifilum breve TaxID=1806508 RepID=A0A160T2H5_9CHLR|nr:HAD family hydrolase [Candidatus Promineifilum breve]CUS02765.2 Haloacid dehalogenase domain protein hydrolase [Candidatus Promineifilum breve]
MIQALLLDLDDTLLGNDIDTFMKGYFALLSAYARPLFDEATFLPHLIQATQAVIADTDPRRANHEVFWQAFEGLTGGRRAELEPFFQRFYDTEFARLRPSTVARPAAAALVGAALDRGLAVVIATNPLFPRVAIEQRLAWAGIAVGDHDYALVTTYENMHAAKPQPAYYREILAAVGHAPAQALMVGDDWRNDINPAATTGLHTYWIAAADAAPPDPALISGQGTLDDLLGLVAGGWLEQLGAPA